MHRYDSIFYDYINAGATRSARVVLRLLSEVLRPSSVVDFGCGEGAWLAVWRERGTQDLVGVDGDYVSRSRLLIPGESFHPADLTRSVELGREFDLVQSLEVAEHLPASAADGFVESLTRHGKIVMFSAAVPGQGGENHLNEQPYEYWQQLFERRDYVPHDWLRPRLREHQEIESWYRYNPVLYVHRSKLGDLPPTLRASAVPPGRAVADVSPLAYRARKCLIRCLPPSAMTVVATLKKHYIVRSRGAVAVNGQ